MIPRRFEHGGQRRRNETERGEAYEIRIVQEALNDAVAEQPDQEAHHQHRLPHVILALQQEVDQHQHGYRIAKSVERTPARAAEAADHAIGGCRA